MYRLLIHKEPKLKSQGCAKTLHIGEGLLVSSDLSVYIAEALVMEDNSLSWSVPRGASVLGSRAK